MDRGILNLINQWLKAPVIEPEDGPKSSGRKHEAGTPQGGVISPLLANIYHACIPHLWERRGHAQTLGGHIVSYADDFVVMLPPGGGAAALEALRSICARLSLTLSEEKTRLVDAVSESFAFLGFEIRKVRNCRTGKRYPRIWPTKKSEQSLRDKLRAQLHRGTRNQPVEEVMREVNQTLRGWFSYFYYGHPQRVMRRARTHVEQRLRKWLMRRHGRRGPGYSQYPPETLYKDYGLFKLSTARPPDPRERLRCEGTPKAGCRKTARPV